MRKDTFLKDSNQLYDGCTIPFRQILLLHSIQVLHSGSSVFPKLKKNKDPLPSGPQQAQGKGSVFRFEVESAKSPSNKGLSSLEPDIK